MQLTIVRSAQAVRSASKAPQQLRSRAAPRPVHFKRSVLAAAAAAEAEDVEEMIVEEEETGATESWAAERLARMEADRAGQQIEEPHYSLNFLWLDKNIGVAVDQIFSKGQRSPVTDYFFWPRRDAWEELKASLEAKTWINERERVLLLNQCTEVINYWQEGEKKTMDQAREAFPDCKFSGSS